MRKFVGLVALFVLMLMVTTTVWGEGEYFLYDLEKNRILVMNPGEAGFSTGLSLEKNPELMMNTGDDHYLALFAPLVTTDKQGRITAYHRPGQLILFNAGSGRTQDLLDIGYAPYKWAFTADHLQFFITYRPKPNEPYELLHYDVMTGKAERLPKFTNQIRGLELSEDGSRIWALVGSGSQEPPRMLNLSYNPLAIKSQLPLGLNPESLYVLSSERAVVLDSGKEGGTTYGSLKLLDPVNNRVVEERRFKPQKAYFNWYPEERVLIAGIDEQSKSRCYKVNRDGFRYYEIPSSWMSLEYLSDQDRLLVLTAENLKLIDYPNSATWVMETGGLNDTPENYQLTRLPGSNLAVIYCPKNGETKFLDLDRKQPVKKVKSGRGGVQFLNALCFNFRSAQTVITTNSGTNRFFVLNQATRDITIFDRNFKRLGYLVPPEPPLAMYQIRQSTLQTLVVTAKRLYRIDEAKLALVPIYEFKYRATPAFFQEETGRIVFMTNQELLVLDPGTLKVQNNFYMFGDPKAQYTKLEPGERRYYFIRPLDPGY